MSFLASPNARLTSDHAVAATQPFFDERPIQGFFNRIDPELPFKIGPLNERESGASRQRLSTNSRGGSET
jgi:hypothetical protein